MARRMPGTLTCCLRAAGPINVHGQMDGLAARSGAVDGAETRDLHVIAVTSMTVVWLASAAARATRMEAEDSRCQRCRRS
jgi:hypothetical protein